MPIQSSLIYRRRAVKLTDQTELIRLCKVNKLFGMVERETLNKDGSFLCERSRSKYKFIQKQKKM